MKTNPKFKMYKIIASLSILIFIVTAITFLNLKRMYIDTDDMNFNKNIPYFFGLLYPRHFEVKYYKNEKESRSYVSVGRHFDDHEQTAIRYSTS